MLNQPKAENSRFSDQELTSYLNDGVQKFFLHINEVSEGQFDKSTTLNLVSGTETVAMPSDFFSIKALYVVDNDTRKILEYRNDTTSDYDASTGNGSSTYRPYYYFRGNNIVLRPIPGYSQTGGLVLEYTAFPETVIFGTDTLTAGISPIFKELVVTYAVYKAKLKDDSVNGGSTRAAIQAHLNDLYTQFKHEVVDRSKYPLFTTPYNPEGVF